MYFYDGLGRRVEKSDYEAAVLKTTTRYVYDGWRVVEELTSTSASNFNLARSYTRGTDLSETFEGAGGMGHRGFLLSCGRSRLRRGLRRRGRGRQEGENCENGGGGRGKSHAPHYGVGDARARTARASFDPMTFSTRV